MALTNLGIQKAYVAFFNRPADAGGLKYWQSFPGTLAQLLSTFKPSAEY